MHDVRVRVPASGVLTRGWGALDVSCRAKYMCWWHDGHGHGIAVRRVHAVNAASALLGWLAGNCGGLPARIVLECRLGELYGQWVAPGIRRVIVACLCAGGQHREMVLRKQILWRVGLVVGWVGVGCAG